MGNICIKRDGKNEGRLKKIAMNWNKADVIKKKARDVCSNFLLFLFFLMELVEGITVVKS
jgi:hypothetical protein